MNLYNVQGFVYIDKRLIGAPGATFLVAKRFGVTNTIRLVIDADAHSGSDDIEIASNDYRVWRVDGTAYGTPDALVTAMNTLLSAPRDLPAKLDATAVQVLADAAAGEIYSDSGVLTIKS